MRTAVIGASGLLGGALTRALAARGWEAAGTYCRAPAPGLERLDLLEPGGVAAFLARVRPEAVLLPAANPYVDECEKRPEETRRLNVEATLEAARAARAARAVFVFYSTDYVFDGLKETPYREEDAPAPLNEYGRQKAAVEHELLGSGGPVLVLRVCALYGNEPQKKNFVFQVLRRLDAGEAMRVPKDQVYTPTHAGSLAAATLGLLERGARGLWHLAGPDVLTREAFARETARAFGLDESLLVPALHAELPNPAGTKRPLRSALDSSKAAALLGEPLWGVKRGLAALRVELGR